MLRDSAHIQEKDAEFFNRKIRKRGEAAVEPLYTMEDAEGVMRRFVGIGYGVPTGVAPGVTATYRDAGHILGSATITLDVETPRGTRTLGFTGDIGNPGRPILRDPEPLPPCDWLISREHLRRQDPRRGRHGRRPPRGRHPPHRRARRKRGRAGLRRRADAGAGLRDGPPRKRGAPPARPGLRRQSAGRQRDRASSGSIPSATTASCWTTS